MVRKILFCWEILLASGCGLLALGAAFISQGIAVGLLLLGGVAFGTFIGKQIYARPEEKSPGSFGYLSDTALEAKRDAARRR